MAGIVAGCSSSDDENNVQDSPKIQLIRNATMKLTYAGKTFLADPMLSAKDAMDPFAGIARNPTVELPFQAQEVIQGADGVIISHYHPDHFDKAASDILAKELPNFLPTRR